MSVGSPSMVAPLRVVLVKHVRDAFVSTERIAAEWRRLGYAAAPELSRALDEYERFLALLTSAGAEVVFQPADETTTLDSLYAHDSAVVAPGGVVLANMGKVARRSEVAALEGLCKERGWPILGRIERPGRLEGGDVCWLDERTVAVGETYRTNAAGIEQLRLLLGDTVDEVMRVPMPHDRGPDECLHLLSAISPVDRDLAVVYPRLLPVPFVQTLHERGVELVEVPDEEYATLGCNVLALAPRAVVMLEGNPETRRRLEGAGVQVLTYPGEEISRKGHGGPTCLTRPILRGGGASVEPQ